MTALRSDRCGNHGLRPIPTDGADQAASRPPSAPPQRSFFNSAATSAEIAIASAEAKKIILCEKPLANTLTETEQMLAAVQRNNVTNMLCHNYRFAPAIALAKCLIDAGEIGEIYHYRGTYLQDWIVNPDFPGVWRLQKSKAGSGALGDIASGGTSACDGCSAAES